MYWEQLNITKTVRKFSIDPNLIPTGSEFHHGTVPKINRHGDEIEDEDADGSVSLTADNFEKFARQYPILVVNFYAPWCYWSNRLKPSWERTAKIMRQRYDPEMDGRILLGKVDCTEEGGLCRRLPILLLGITSCKKGFVHNQRLRNSFPFKYRADMLLDAPPKHLQRHHIQGYPSIRIFRRGNDIKENHGHHEHESYYGERDTESLVVAMETLVAPVPREFHKLALDDKSGQTIDTAKRPAPLTSGCRIEGFVLVKKVPGSLVISARSGAHSFDPSQINVSHVISQFSFGKKLTPQMLSEAKRLSPYVGGSHDRLTGRSYITNHADDVNANVTIEHYLQLVKTEIASRKSSREFKLLEEYEYTAHSSLVHSLHIPAAKFHFEPSPMQVLVTEVPKFFSHFITNVCAIIGGIFTVAGILDSILHNTIRLMRKVELGKQF
ncbi:protein disulfide isomerase-like 5-4 isoform X4 [Phoenix dactylifera]|uniref:Protein disulfide isomerase-like 5-4 isoform X4 n=1 Tax=Phoenix dactylifera TaxID=42345 RepID=A0A8B9AF60_PHODC|nr:protein disulfide isomerase-like 5-4 isoform X4 [Phoenix dactylifera]